MAENLGRKLIASHLPDGEMVPGAAIALRIDQTLTQDGTGTLAMLSLESLDLDRVRSEVSVQYVDHNLLQTDNLNADDHLFLESSSREHVAVAPRDPGLRIVFAKSFARIHRQNLTNYGVLPLTFANPADYDRLARDDVLSARNLRRKLQDGREITLECNGAVATRRRLTPKQIGVILAGGVINWRRNRKKAAPRKAS